MTNSIKKTILLKAPINRVWLALTDHEQFGEWFRVKLDGPFVVNEVSLGQITYPGYEHLPWRVTVLAIEHEKLFSFSWCPNADEVDVDYSKESQILVEFRLKEMHSGTRLEIIESGFDGIPDDKKRTEALRVNTQGWNIQAENITAYVES